MYSNSVSKPNPITGVQIHLKHELKEKKKKFDTSHNAFIILRT